jgi:cation transport regulator
MPYESNNSLPKGVRKKLTDHQQTVFRKAFNNALREYGKESTAYKVAWSAAKNA